MNPREGFPSKFLFEIEFHKLFLNFGDPFARIFITVNVNHDKKGILKCPIAKKESKIGESITFNLLLFENFLNRFNDLIVLIEVLLLKKENQKKLVGNLEINIAELAVRAFKMMFEETHTLELNNSSHYNGKLNLTIKLTHLTKKQMRSLSQSTRFFTDLKLKETVEVEIEETRKEKTKKRGYVRPIDQDEPNQGSFDLDNDNKSENKLRNSEAKSYSQEYRISLIEQIEQRDSDNFKDNFKELLKEKKEIEIQTEEEMFGLIDNNLMKEEFENKIMASEKIILQKEKEARLINERLERIESNVKDFEDEVNFLKKELQLKEEKIFEIEEEKNTLKKQIDLEKMEFLKKNNNLIEELDKNIKKEAMNQKKIRNLESSLEELKTNNEILKEKINEEGTRKISNEKDYEEIKNKLKTLEQYNENLKKQINNKEIKLAELEESNTQIQSEYLKTKQKLAEVLNCVFEKGGTDLMEEIEASLGLDSY